MSETKSYATSLHRIIAALSHRSTPEEVAEGVVHEAMPLFGASACIVVLFDLERDRQRIVAHAGVPQSQLDHWTSQPLSSFSLATLILRGQATFAPSRIRDERFDPSLAQHVGPGGAFFVPLQAAGRVLGAFGMSFHEVREFDAGEREFILSLAGHCAQSLDRACLFEAARAATLAADEARRQLEAVLRQLPVGVAITCCSTGRVMINEEAQRILGDDAAQQTQQLPVARAKRGETICAEEVTLTNGDGSARRLRLNGGPIRDDAGNITAAVAVFRDITAEHEAAETLRKHERRYRAMLRATNDVIWEYDAGQRNVEWNGAVERQFGHRPDDMESYGAGPFQWWLDHIHPEDREPATSSFSEALNRGQDTWTREYRIRHADGSWVATVDRCVFERDEAGVLLRVIGSLTNVSEQRRLLDDLREAIRIRDEFLSIAGHELRTPLAALKAQLLGLRQLPLDDARRDRKLAAAERQTRRLGALVDELLDVSRIVHGKLQLQCEDIDLAEVVREAVVRLEDEFELGGTVLEVDATTPVRGRWDRLRLDLIVTNLLTNALRYGEKRPVRVRVGHDGARARLEVRDEGIGIHADDHERIFERFARAAPSRQFGGLGVGLWLARQIAEAHGGSLAVASAPGAGATFTLELPGDA